MGHTFLFTTEVEGRTSAIKFESVFCNATEFKVTMLSKPEIPAFTISLEKGDWHVNSNGCLLIASIKDRLIEAAKRFQR